MRVLFCLSMLLPLAFCQARQVREVEIAADSAFTSRRGGVDVTELFNFRLRQEDTFLRADRAIDYGNGRFDFFRNVRIIDSGDTLTAREVKYNRHTKVGRATGNVRLGDGEVVVTAPEGDFDVRAHRADFRAGVRLVDSVSVLTSQTGVYWTEEKRAEFAGSVRLDSEDSDVLADSLRYWRDGQRSDARGNVLIVRPAEDGATYIFSDSALNDDSLGTGQASGSVLIARMRVDSTGAAQDTLFIRSERVYSERLEGSDRLAARGSVSVWNGKLAAVADSVHHVSTQESGPTESRLFGDPFLWVDRSQVSGDTIRVVGRGSSIDSLLVAGSAFVAQEDSVLLRLQQLKGRRLVGLFEADSLRSLQVAPNAEAVYFNKTDENELGGALQVSADRIRFQFAGGEISDLRIYTGIDGTYYPVGQIPDGLKLDGLRWRPEARPDLGSSRLRLLAGLCRLAPCPEQDN